jgi:hypothetical protein
MAQADELRLVEALVEGRRNLQAHAGRLLDGPTDWQGETKLRSRFYSASERAVAGALAGDRSQGAATSGMGRGSTDQSTTTSYSKGQRLNEWRQAYTSGPGLDLTRYGLTCAKADPIRGRPERCQPDQVPT